MKEPFVAVKKLDLDRDPFADNLFKIDGVVLRKELQFKFKQAGHPLISRETRKQQLVCFQRGIDCDQFIVLRKAHGMSPSVFQDSGYGLEKAVDQKRPVLMPAVKMPLKTAFYRGRRFTKN